jgi:hypothetical protein
MGIGRCQAQPPEHLRQGISGQGGRGRDSAGAKMRSRTDRGELNSGEAKDSTRGDSGVRDIGGGDSRLESNG